MNTLPHILVHRDEKGFLRERTLTHDEAQVHMDRHDSPSAAAADLRADQS